MSRLRYHTATLSLRLNVQKSGSRSLPFAFLVLGEMEDRPEVAVAALALFVPTRVRSRALKSVCADLPVVLPLLLEDVLSRDTGRTPTEALLHIVEDSFRNSVFVSEVSYNQLETVSDVSQAGYFASGLARKRVQAFQMAEARRSRKPSAPRPKRAESFGSKWWHLPTGSDSAVSAGL